MPSTEATKLRDLAAPLAARPGSSLAFSDLQPTRYHRRGRRSAGALSKRAALWLSRCDSLRGNFSDDNGHDADDSVAVVRDEIVQETSRETTNRRSRQSGPPTPCIEDTFSIFHLNPQGISTASIRAKVDVLVTANPATKHCGHN